MVSKLNVRDLYEVADALADASAYLEHMQDLMHASTPTLDRAMPAADKRIASLLIELRYREWLLDEHALTPRRRR